MLPTVTNYANSDGSVSQKNIDYYALRENLAAIIIEASYAHLMGKSFANQLGIESDDKIDGLSKISNVIHNNGALAGIQLAMNVKSKTINKLTILDIEDIQNSFVNAALRAKSSNFDIIEIHCAHGWLLGQFLSSYFNQRSDLFGGTLQNRFRLPLEIIGSIRHKLKDQVLSVRVNASDFVEGGIDLNESLMFAKELKNIGVDLISVSAGIKTFIHVSNAIYPKGFLLDFASQIKANTNLPTIAANRLNDFDIATLAIEQEKTDFVGLARSLIADPKIATKWQNGQLRSVVPCLNCNQECIANIGAQKQMSCLINPNPYSSKVFQQPFMYKRKVMVVGAGIAGLAFSVFAKKKGLNCIVFERQSKIGGQINLAYKPPYKQEFKKIIDYYTYEIQNLNIDVYTNIEVDTELIKSEKPDIVVFATGSSPYIPEFVLNNEYALTADEVLEFGVPFDARCVAVLGGGLVGLETANFLANQGLSVSVFEMEDSLLKNTVEVLRLPILESLHSNIKVFLDHQLVNIENNTAIFQHENTLDKYTFDYLVLALGRRPNVDLINKINFCIDTINIGDCKRPHDVHAAICDAYNAAIML